MKLNFHKPHEIAGNYPKFFHGLDPASDTLHAVSDSYTVWRYSVSEKFDGSRLLNEDIYFTWFLVDLCGLIQEVHKQQINVPLPENFQDVIDFDFKKGKEECYSNT